MSVLGSVVGRGRRRGRKRDRGLGNAAAEQPDPDRVASKQGNNNQLRQAHLASKQAC